MRFDRGLLPNSHPVARDFLQTQPDAALTPQASRYAVIHRPIQADQFDAKMIVHPPQSSIGVLPPGIPVARNLYPDLQLQFIGQTSTARLEIPIYWPNLSIEPIPIAWPKLKAVPAQDSTAAVATPPAK